MSNSFLFFPFFWYDKEKDSKTWYLFAEQSKYLQGPSQFAVISLKDFTEIELIFPHGDFDDVDLEESPETGQWKVHYTLNSYEALQV